MIICNMMRALVYGSMIRSRVDNNTRLKPGRAYESNFKRVRINKTLNMGYCISGASTVPTSG
jgi:hypothetical protein